MKFPFEMSRAMHSIALLSLACLLAVAGVSRARGAGSASVVERATRHVTIDWTRGLILATGAATGDLRAPTPQVARVAARRQAREQAAARLLAVARGLALGSRTVADHADADEGVAARLGRAIEAAPVLSVTHGSDGSVVMSVGLPIEAVRVAVQGPAGHGPASPDSPTAIVVDARGVLARPALGVSLWLDGRGRAAPAIYHRTMNAALRDRRVGQRPIQVTATGVETHEDAGDHLRIDAAHPAGTPAGTITGALEAGALVIIVIGKKT